MYWIPEFAAIVVSTAFLGFLTLVIYRLFFHSLSKFPGPWLAAATGWWEFYFEMLHGEGGQYVRKIEQMHQKYGPIVRITPDELHIDDAEFYEVLFAGNSQVRDKYARAAHMAGSSLGIFSTIDHHLHRRRRATLNHFFSKTAVRNHDHILQAQIDKLCLCLDRYAAENQPVELTTVCLAFATDFFMAYAFDKPVFPPILGSDSFQKKWRRTIDGLAELTPLMKQFPWLATTLTVFPVGILRIMTPQFALMLEMKQAISRCAREERDAWVAGEGCESSDGVFVTILGSVLPAEDKSISRLEEEGFELLGASGETVTKTVSNVLFHLVSNPSKLERLRREVDPIYVKVGANMRPSVTQLEQLPYLYAVIKESLRMEPPNTARLPLQAPEDTLQFGGYSIPSNTPISMTPYQHMINDKYFPDPTIFHPERWLAEDGFERPSDRYFFAFSKGSRGCPGINIAYAELLALTATLIHRYDMQLFDTTYERDIKYTRDFFVGKACAASKGIRVTLQLRAPVL